MAHSSLYKQIRSNIILIIAAVMWGFAFVAQLKASENGIGSFLFNAIRYFLGALVLIPVIIIFERKQITRSVLRRSMIAGLISGTIMMAAVNVQQYGIALNQNAGTSGFISSFYIVFIPIVSSLVFRQKVNIRSWIAVAVAFIGLFLISVPLGSRVFDTKKLLGECLLMLCAIFWTAHILSVDRFSKESCPILFAFLQFSFCSVISFLFALFVDEISLSVISASLAPILYGGFISVGIAYTFQVLGQRDASAVVTSIAMAGEAVFAAVGGFLFMGETMSFQQIIGAIMMSGAIVLPQITLKNKKKTN
ncbi:MAG: DMT family transporter [Clostridia bacterium]|nr:DMT family transporter [Clostridia bacterium]